METNTTPSESQSLCGQDSNATHAQPPSSSVNNAPLQKKPRHLMLAIAVAIAISSLIPMLPLCRHLIGNSFMPSAYHKDPTTSASRLSPQYWIYNKGNSEAHLKHVLAVLQRLGIDRAATNTTATWDLLWAHDYPFRALHPHLHRLRPHQLVNHFPGTGFLTNKVSLATSANLPHIPPAFELPAQRAEFLAYAERYPDKKFVQKHNQHRHVVVRNVSEIRFDDADSFLQEFVEDPFLVDGHKFDIGVYVTITSVDPLRVYIYGGDVLFRYCPLPYYPFDAGQLDKYVVGDDYMPTWEVPSLAHSYTKLGYGMRDAFDAYVRLQGHKPEVIWDRVEDAIRMAVLAKEKHIVDALKNFPHKRNFFEMMRFDLVIDAQLNVFLLEANMSPNLSSAHFLPNQLLYEQVLYNMMQLVGVGSPLNRSSFVAERSLSAQEMLSSTKNIMVDADICTSVPCTQSCAAIQCQLCRPCLSDDDILDLHNSYREHMRKGDQKRIFPSTAMTEADELGMTSRNRLLSRWFRKKCEKDATWCT